MRRHLHFLNRGRSFISATQICWLGAGDRSTPALSPSLVMCCAHEYSWQASSGAKTIRELTQEESFFSWVSLTSWLAQRWNEGSRNGLLGWFSQNVKLHLETWPVYLLESRKR